jgi:hypothetical protein
MEALLRVKSQHGGGESFMKNEWEHKCVTRDEKHLPRKIPHGARNAFVQKRRDRFHLPLGHATKELNKCG